MPVCETLGIQQATQPNQLMLLNQQQTGQSASAISVGGSPFTYQNTNGVEGCVIVSGGTVTTISISRDGTNFFLVGLLAGLFRLSPGDFLRVAYVLTPTMTWLPC